MIASPHGSFDFTNPIGYMDTGSMSPKTHL